MRAHKNAAPVVAASRLPVITACGAAACVGLPGAGPDLSPPAHLSRGWRCREEEGRGEGGAPPLSPRQRKLDALFRETQVAGAYGGVWCVGYRA